MNAILFQKKGLVRDLRKLLPRDSVKGDPEDLLPYASDASFHFVSRTPNVVVLPNSVEEIARLIKYAAAQRIPVTPRGAGSGLSGGCTPIKGGIVLDMKRMNRILEINRRNMTATVEPGVVLNQFHQETEKRKLFYPPDPQSKLVCTIGGTVATRAGGPRGVKYGTTGQYVLGLEVVLPNGEVIQTGGTCLKNSAGYNLTQLFTGSEGTLGVITKINLRLIPLPPAEKTVIVSCRTTELAANLISEIISNGIVPAVLEYLSKSPIKLFNKKIQPPLSMDGEAYLFMKLDGTETQIEEEVKQLRDVCLQEDVVEFRVVDDQEKAETYWKLRSSLYPLKMSLVDRIIAEDVTVPRDRIPEFIASVKQISDTSGIKIGVSGHAGDGNMHPSIILPKADEFSDEQVQRVIREVIDCGLSLGGNISGEHGIGILKSEFLPLELGEVQLNLMKAIKKVVDPFGIMNPGKLWED